MSLKDLSKPNDGNTNIHQFIHGYYSIKVPSLISFCVSPNNRHCESDCRSAERFKSIGWCAARQELLSEIQAGTRKTSEVGSKEEEKEDWAIGPEGKFVLFPKYDGKEEPHKNKKAFTL